MYKSWLLNRAHPVKDWIKCVRKNNQTQGVCERVLWWVNCGPSCSGQIHTVRFSCQAGGESSNTRTARIFPPKVLPTPLFCYSPSVHLKTQSQKNKASVCACVLLELLFDCAVTPHLRDVFKGLARFFFFFFFFFLVYFIFADKWSQWKRTIDHWTSLTGRIDGDNKSRCSSGAQRQTWAASMPGASTAGCL